MVSVKRLLVVLLISSSLYAADWVANSCSGGNISTCDWRPTSTGSCTGSGTALVWGAQGSGDNFYSNGCASAIVINSVDPGPNGTVTLRNDANGVATAGGSFSLTLANCAAIASPNAGTVHANFQAGSATVFTLTGTSSTCNIIGNANGSAATSSASGTSITATTGTVNWTGNVSGGGATTAYGILISGATSFNLTGNAIGGTGSTAYGLNINAASGSATITGNCVGSDTINAPGCFAGAAETLTVAGNIVSGKRGTGASGTIFVNPTSTKAEYRPANSSAALSDIVNTTTGVINSPPTLTNYKEFPLAPAITDVKNGVAYGSLTGTYAGGGGTKVCASAN